MKQNEKHAEKIHNFDDMTPRNNVGFLSILKLKFYFNIITERGKV
jgi:hypothetical protein